MLAFQWCKIKNRMKSLDHRIFERLSKFCERIRVCRHGKNSLALLDGKYQVFFFLSSGVVALMGEPIKQLGFDTKDEKNWCDGARAKFHVRVKGPKDRGSSCFNTNQWQIILFETHSFLIRRTSIFLGHNWRGRKMEHQSSRIGIKFETGSKTPS